MTLATRDLAGLVCGIRFDDLPDPVVDAARRCIVDTVGVMVAGRRTGTAGIIAEYAARRGTHPVSGCSSGLRLTGPPDIAALMHATTGHALDFDDGCPGAVHPSSPVLAAVLGMALAPPEARLGTRALIEAFVAGWEAVARVTRALGTGHYRAGWHTTGTAGTFGATAAACRVAGLDVDTTRQAFGIAGSLAAGLRRNFGTMTKPLHSGLAARNGVMAAESASLGHTADDDVLDGCGGFLDIYGGGGENPAEIGATGRRYALVDPGPIVKAYPCCYAAARGIDAMRRLGRELTLSAGTVASIQCAGPVGSFAALTHPRPNTGLESRFSMSYALAAAVLDGVPTLASFTDEAVRRPEARALMERVTVSEQSQCRPEDPEGVRSSPVSGGFVEVTATTTAGRTATVRVAHAHGSPDDPLSWPELEEKYRGCLASGGIGIREADSLLARLRQGDHPDVFPDAGTAHVNDASDEASGHASRRTHMPRTDPPPNEETR